MKTAEQDLKFLQGLVVNQLSARKLVTFNRKHLKNKEKDIKEVLGKYKLKIDIYSLTKVLRQNFCDLIHIQPPLPALCRSFWLSFFLRREEKRLLYTE